MEERERGMDEKEKSEKEGSEKEIKGGAEKQGNEIPKKKKKWVKPVITRVKLNPEMAVMGVCSMSASTMQDSVPVGCTEIGHCRQASSEGAAVTNCDSEASS